MRWFSVLVILISFMACGHKDPEIKVNRSTEAITTGIGVQKLPSEEPYPPLNRFMVDGVIIESRDYGSFVTVNVCDKTGLTISSTYVWRTTDEIVASMDDTKDVAARGVGVPVQ
jgi:hypothetical protein